MTTSSPEFGITLYMLLAPLSILGWAKVEARLEAREARKTSQKEM